MFSVAGVSRTKETAASNCPSHLTFPAGTALPNRRHCWNFGHILLLNYVEPDHIVKGPLAVPTDGQGAPPVILPTRNAHVFPNTALRERHKPCAPS